MILQFTKQGMGNEKGSDAFCGEQDSERAINISRLENELADAIRQKQDLEAQAKKVATDFNSTLPIILDSKLQLIRVQQKITTLLICQLLVIFDTEKKINVAGIENLLE